MAPSTSRLAIREYAGGKTRWPNRYVEPSAGSPTTISVPWCLAPATDPSKQAAVAKFLADNTVNVPAAPLCPAALLGHLADATAPAHAKNAFALRGAINAGFAYSTISTKFSKGSPALALRRMHSSSPSP